MKTQKFECIKHLVKMRIRRFAENAYDERRRESLFDDFETCGWRDAFATFLSESLLYKVPRKFAHAFLDEWLAFCETAKETAKDYANKCASDFECASDFDFVNDDARFDCTPDFKAKPKKACCGKCKAKGETPKGDGFNESELLGENVPF